MRGPLDHAEELLCKAGHDLLAGDADSHPELSPLVPQMNALAPYAMQNWYLRTWEPDEEEAREVLSLAHEVYNRVRGTIPQPLPET
jgi:hypothetical protein